MMKSKEFINKLKDIALNYKTLYVMGCFGSPLTGSNVDRYCNNHDYNKKHDRTALIKSNANKNPVVYGFDCVCLIKGVLWGWNGNNKDNYGGAKYKSNNVPDLDANTFFNKCSNISTNFSNITVGEAVWCSGHIGIYIGDGLAIECTPSWKNNVQITAVRNMGLKSGYNARTWTKHGKLPYVDYSDQVAPTYVGYLDTVTNSVISGWAWNSVDDTALKVDLKIYKGTVLVKTLTTTANIYRADLLNARKGNGKHGFSINFNFNTLDAGIYTVKAYVSDKQLTNVKSVNVVKTVLTEKDKFISNMKSALGLSANATVQQVFEKTPELYNNNKYNKVTIVVQNYLNVLGFNCGTADGYFGNNTEKAVKAYQSKYTGVADGVMSAKGMMWKHLLGIL